MSYNRHENRCHNCADYIWAAGDFWSDPILLAYKFKKENLYGLLFQSLKMTFILFIYLSSGPDFVINSFPVICTTILFNTYLSPYY